MSFGGTATINRDVVAKENPAIAETLSGYRLAIIRRDPEHLFGEIPKWFEKIFEGKKVEIISHQQTESNGNITISVLYRV